VKKVKGMIEECNAVTIVKYCSGSPGTKLDVTGHEPKKPKISLSFGENSESGLRLNDCEDVDKTCDLKCVVTEDAAELMANDELE